MKTAAIAKGMGVVVATMLAKSKIIQEGLTSGNSTPTGACQHDGREPYDLMLKVNGMFLDIRMRPERRKKRLTAKD